MRYVLLTSMILATFVAAVILGHFRSWGGYRVTSYGATRSKTLGARVVPLPTIPVIPTVSVPHVSVYNPVTTRDQAIGLAKRLSMRLSEDNPVLIDAVLTTQKDARDRLRDPDGTPSDGPDPRSTGIPPDAAVWLVRMRGSFVADAVGPGDEGKVFPPTPGWMFVVINAANGQVLGYGIMPQEFPIR